MTFIRRVAAALTLWALATCVWAALSHLTSLRGPAKASTATLEGVANLVERADPPGVFRVSRAAATQLRRTAHTAGRINGGIERAIGAWLDRLGHDAAHGPDARFRSAARAADMAVIRLRAARQGETFSLKAAEAGSALDEAAIRLDVAANLDRDKIKKRLEKLLDVLEDLQEFEGGR